MLFPSSPSPPFFLIYFIDVIYGFFKHNFAEAAFVWHFEMVRMPRGWKQKCCEFKFVHMRKTLVPRHTAIGFDWWLPAAAKEMATATNACAVHREQGKSLFIAPIQNGNSVHRARAKEKQCVK